MKMIDLGTKWDDMGKVDATPAKDRKSYPSLYLDQKQIKALGLDGARVGQSADLCIKVYVRSTSEDASGGGSVSLEIREAAIEEADKPDPAGVLYPKG